MGQNRITITLLVACVATVAWGALAFGAVYPWAYTPLAIMAAVVGAAALVLERRGRPPIGALAIGLIATGAAIALQLAPLPLVMLARVSPNADAFLRQYNFAYGGSAHALSIAPDKTAVGLALFSALAVFLLGTSRLLSATGANKIVRPLIFFGVLLALVGITDRAITATDVHPLIYGFWKPQFDSRPFAPFVNPNHFAGWMLMTLPLALAAFYDALLRTLDVMPARGRGRIGVAATPAFGWLLGLGLVCLVMGLSLFMTKSRSGIAAFAVGSSLAGWTVFRRQESRMAKAAVVASFLLILVGTVGWAGLDTIVGKFMDPDMRLADAGGRLGAWKDTVGMVRKFPLTGAGLDTYGVGMALYQTGSRTLHFQEAHNDYLQLAAEGGLLVGIPVLAALALFVRDVRRRFREAPKKGTTYWLRVGAVIGLVSIALQSLVEFSLQMPGNAALFAVVAAIAIHQSPNLRTGSSTDRGARSTAGA